MRNIPLEKLEFMAIILKTISHPIRIQIIELLEDKEKMSVNDICEKLGNIEQSLLSHHLIKMKDKGILKSKKEGQFVYYSLYLKEVSNMLDCMERCTIK